MQLLVGFHHSEQWQALVAKCKLPVSSGLPVSANAARLDSSLDIPQLANLLAESTQLHILLCYDAPERYIGQRLTNGQSFDAALESWFTQTKELLLLQQQYRRRLQLLQTDAALNQNAELPDWLQQNLDVLAVPALTDTVDDLLAAQLLRQNNEAAKLNLRLQASSLPQQATNSQLNLVLIKQQIANRSEVEALHSQLAASNEEHELLLQQLQHVQQELEQLFQKKLHIKQHCSQLEHDYRTDVSQLSARLKDGEHTIEKTAAQLHNLQGELTRLTTVHNSLQEQLADKSDIEALQSQLTASNDGRDLLLQQLQQVQQELEQYYLECQRLNSASSKGQLQLKQLTIENDSFKSKQSDYEKQKHTDQATIEKLTNSLKQAEREIQQLQKAAVSADTELDKVTKEVVRVRNIKLAEELELKQRLLNSDFAATEATGKLKVLEIKYSTEVSQLSQALDKAQKAEKKLKEQLKNQQENAWREHQAAVANQKKLERELQKQQKLFTNQKSQLNALRLQLTGSEQQLQSITNSRLWRTVAPVRSISNRLHKSANQAKEKLQQDMALILTSEYFDLDWYVKTYPDVAESDINPAEHYLSFGAKEGRYPGPLFDGNWYLKHNDDVAKAGLNPLLHYIKYGQAEGRTASPILLANTATKSLVKAEVNTAAPKAAKSVSGKKGTRK